MALHRYLYASFFYAVDKRGAKRLNDCAVMQCYQSASFLRFLQQARRVPERESIFQGTDTEHSKRGCVSVCGVFTPAEHGPLFLALEAPSLSPALSPALCCEIYAKPLPKAGI